MASITVKFVGRGGGGARLARLAVLAIEEMEEDLVEDDVVEKVVVEEVVVEEVIVEGEVVEEVGVTGGPPWVTLTFVTCSDNSSATPGLLYVQENVNDAQLVASGRGFWKVRRAAVGEGLGVTDKATF